MPVIWTADEELDIGDLGEQRATHLLRLSLGHVSHLPRDFVKGWKQEAD